MKKIFTVMLAVATALAVTTCVALLGWYAICCIPSLPLKLATLAPMLGGMLVSEHLLGIAEEIWRRG